MGDKLKGTPLADRETHTLSMPDGAEVLAIRTDSRTFLSDWILAGRLPGESPVAVTCWGSSGDWKTAMSEEQLLMRAPFEGQHPAQVLHAAEQLDASRVVADLLELERELEPTLDEEELAYTLEECTTLLGDAPSIKSLRTSVQHSALPPSIAAQHALVQYAQRLGTPKYSGNLEWFEPLGQPCAILLLKADQSVDALAHVHWFGAHESTASTLAVMRRWEDRFDAKLVAHWGTMLQFIVGRPPQTIPEAWDLALEQVLLAPCTTQLSGVGLWRHAFDLLGRKTWFLHERP